MELVKYNEACRAIAEAKNIDEVKDVRDKAVAIRAYAKQAKNRQLEADAYEIRIRAERRLGEMLREQKETIGLNSGAVGSIVTGTIRVPVKDLRPTLASLGIGKKLSSRVQSIAAVPEESFEKQVKKSRNSIINGPTVGRGTGEQENYTPKYIIDLVKEVFGKIDLDPASCERANEVVGAQYFYTQKDDGLSLPWSGNVFINPPYQQPEISLFCKKLVEELGNIKAAILLVNNNTDTRWFHLVAEVSSAICFTKGRISFYTEESPSTSPTNGQSILYFGKDVESFCAVFSKIGIIMEVVNEVQRR